MSDIHHVLPGFKTSPFAHILPSLDKAAISSVDLITLSPVEVAKRAQVPPVEVAKLSEALAQALQKDNLERKSKAPFVDVTSDAMRGDVVSTLDETIDAALEGGVKTGCITEFTGESGVGKTQFMLTLLLAVQLPPPHGLSRSALYVSTEAALSTSRLSQLLDIHPQLASLPPKERPSLDRVLSIQTPDIESQEHILRYQVPVAIQRHNVGLLVIDSIAANYRAEFELSNTKNDKPPGESKKPMPTKGKRAVQSMAERRPQLIQLGAFLRSLARDKSIAIVVSNQIADRFSPDPAPGPPPPMGGYGSHPPTQSTPSQPFEPITLDHQQRWFTGWGDVREQTTNLKTPSLGLVWTNQISARVALVKDSRAHNREEKTRRWVRVVFASWAAPSLGKGVEYEIFGRGVVAVGEEQTSTTIERQKS